MLKEQSTSTDFPYNSKTSLPFTQRLLKPNARCYKRSFDLGHLEFLCVHKNLKANIYVYLWLICRTEIQFSLVSHLVVVEKKVGFTHRSRMGIVAGILRVSKGGTRKTHIMYRNNLSFKQLRAYLGFLTNSGLVREISKSGSSFFETTDKGLAFLQAYNNLKALLGE